MANHEQINTPTFPCCENFLQSSFFPAWALGMSSLPQGWKWITSSCRKARRFPVENVLPGEKLLRKEWQTQSYSKLHPQVLGAVSWCWSQVQQMDETKVALVQGQLSCLRARVSKRFEPRSEWISPCHQRLHRQALNPEQRSSPQINCGHFGEELWPRFVHRPPEAEPCPRDEVNQLPGKP